MSKFISGIALGGVAAALMFLGDKGNVEIFWCCLGISGAASLAAIAWVKSR